MDTCFLLKKKNTFFLGPSGPRIPAFSLFSHAQRGLGYLLLLFFFLFLLPIGAVDTCFNFFFHGPTGRLVDGNMVLWVIALPGISMPLICVYCCCWSFGAVWVNLWLRKNDFALKLSGCSGRGEPASAIMVSAWYGYSRASYAKN